MECLATRDGVFGRAFPAIARIEIQYSFSDDYCPTFVVFSANSGVNFELHATVQKPKLFLKRSLAWKWCPAMLRESVRRPTAGPEGSLLRLPGLPSLPLSRTLRRRFWATTNALAKGKSVGCI